MITPLTEEEMLEIASSLEDYHKIFYVFWELAEVSFDDSVKTACVHIPKKSKPSMKLGPEFWKGLNLRERLFVICHECLHVMLDHGIRNGMDVPGATPTLVNQAQDITINEMIVSLFHFDRKDLRGWEKYCWIDTCFKDPSTIKQNETFIYYLEKLIENLPKDGGSGGDGPKTLDDHDHKEDDTGNSEPTDDDEEEDNKDDLAGKLAEELTVEEIEKILDALPPMGDGEGEAGTMRGVLNAIIEKKVKKLKVQFSHIVRKLKKTSMKEIERDLESFTHEDRRFGDVLRRADIALPGKASITRPSPDRLLTAVFMDISASCMAYFPIFTQVFLAFDAEKEIFDTRLFTFDTAVVEVKPGYSISVGGGTMFNIIEQKCLELEAEVGRYPDCVVIITDGYGNEVKPKAPSKWIFLLTPTVWTESLIPYKSRKFFINQITF